MPAQDSTAVRITDAQDNSCAFASFEDGLNGVRAWFPDALEATCQGLSDSGIEEVFPGLQARLGEAIASVPTPAAELTVEELARFANEIARSVLACCRDQGEREAVGVPTQFSVRPASRLEVPDFAALAALARNR